MLFTKSHLASLGVAAFMACAIPALAQDLQALVQAESDVFEPKGEIENRYRIGLDCRPARPELKSHLKLDDDTGLMVQTALPGSPAGVAGIRKYDVIVEANGHPVGQVMDLVEQVNEAKGNEMSITLIREGEEHLLKLTPEERDEKELDRLRNGFRDQLGRQAMPGFGAMNLGADFEEMLKQFPQMQLQFGNGAFQRINPGIAMPPIPNLPNSFSVQIQNDQITVQHGDDHYEVTKDTIDELPDDVRPLVENMLNRGQFNLGGLFAPGMNRPAMPANPVPPAKNKRFEDRFDGLEIQMRELQDAIRSIKDN